MRRFHVQYYCLPLLLAVCIGCGGAAANSNTSANPTGTGQNSDPPTTGSVGPLTGVWSGSMQVTMGPAGQSAITLTVTLNNTISNAQSTITGALAVADTPCFAPTTLPIPPALFQDPNFDFEVPTSNGTFHLFGKLVDAATLAAQFEIRGGTCDRMAGTGTLKKQTSSASVPGIRILFKVAQGGTYGGELWVFPPTFVVSGCVAEARAHGVDTAGVSQAVNANWTPEDPKMVVVSPSEGHQVTITVLAAGTSSVRISTAGFPSKVLSIQAAQSNNSTICTFSQ